MSPHGAEQSNVTPSTILLRKQVNHICQKIVPQSSICHEVIQFAHRSKGFFLMALTMIFRESGQCTAIPEIPGRARSAIPAHVALRTSKKLGFTVGVKTIMYLRQ